MDWVRWALRRHQRLRISGDSMEPTLNEGDLVFVDMRAYRTSTPAANEIVVARHPYQRDLRIAKRVSHTTNAGRVYLISDNPNMGTDSRVFGAVASERVLGRVVSRIVVSRIVVR